MPVHDWTRVSAGTFHDFHGAWIIHLKETLNNGLLPEGFYAQSEQHAGQILTDVLTLQAPEIGTSSVPESGGVAVAEMPPRVSRRMMGVEPKKGTPRTLTIRHASGHRIVAILEVVSPSNKDRSDHVQQFVHKAYSALEYSCHVLIVDLFPPGAHDPHGMLSAIWKYYRSEEEDWPDEKPLCMASFVAKHPPEIYVEPVAVGEKLIDMPLFCTTERYINTPLESTYMAAWRGMPAYWRNVLEQ